MLDLARPGVAILGADQKERGLWGRECLRSGLLKSEVIQICGGKFISFPNIHMNLIYMN